MGAVAVPTGSTRRSPKLRPRRRSALPWLYLFRAIRRPAPPGARLMLQIYEDEGLFERAGFRTISSMRSGRCATFPSSAISAASGFSPGSRSTRRREAGAAGDRAAEAAFSGTGRHVKWTGDTAIVAPSLVAERGARRRDRGGAAADFGGGLREGCDVRGLRDSGDAQCMHNSCTARMPVVCGGRPVIQGDLLLILWGCPSRGACLPRRRRPTRATPRPGWPGRSRRRSGSWRRSIRRSSNAA